MSLKQTMERCGNFIQGGVFMLMGDNSVVVHG